MAKRASTVSQRKAAVALAGEIGTTKAAEQLGLKPGTVRSWVARAAAREEPRMLRDPGAEVPEDLATVTRLRDAAVVQLEALMQQGGKELAVQRMTIAVATLMDKVRDAERYHSGKPSDPVESADARARLRELRDRLIVARRERLRVKVAGGIGVADPDVAEFWLAMVGCERGEPSGEGPRVAPRVSDEEFKRRYVRRFGEGLGAPGPFVRPVPAPAVEVPDDEDVELLEDDGVPGVELVPVPARRRALPRAGASQFPPGSIQRKLGGWEGGGT